MALARKDPHDLPAAGASTGDDFQVDARLLDVIRSASLRIGGARLNSVGVTSTIRGEGKTTIALALALVQALDYRRGVILLEMDIENPSLADQLRIRHRPGLAELASGHATVEEVVQAVSDGIGVITAGGRMWSWAKIATEVTSSGVLTAILNETDIVIADLPAQTSGLGRHWNEAFQRLVYVVRAGITPLPRVRAAISSLPSEPALLLNGTDSSLPRWLRLILGL
jgi:Mrp family chromosome partitioning ATPase